MPPQPDERLRIRNALIDLLYERSYAELTLELLLERAGVDRIAFERHFADLEDCHCQVFESERDQLLKYLEEAREGATSWRERLRLTGYALYRFFRAHEEVTHFMIKEVRSGGERAQLLWAEGLANGFELVREGSGELTDPDSISPTTAEQIVGGVANQYYTALGKVNLPPEEEIIPELMYLAVLPYLGPDAALEELDIPPPPVLPVDPWPPPSEG